MSNSKTLLIKEKKTDIVLGYRITNKAGDVFNIPILDNRNPKHQERIQKTTKELNSMKGSNYFRPSFSLLGFSYNVSRKR